MIDCLHDLPLRVYSMAILARLTCLLVSHFTIGIRNRISMGIKPGKAEKFIQFINQFFAAYMFQVFRHFMHFIPFKF